MEKIKFFKHGEKNKYKYNIKRKFKKSRKNSIIKINNYNYSHMKKTRTNKIKNTHKNNKKIFNIFFNLIGLILFVASYYFYYLSLEKCFEGEDACSKKLEWIKLKIIQLIISVVIIIVLLILIIYSILSKLHLFHFITTFICFYRFSHSSYFHDHGAFNLICLFVIIFLSLLLLLFLKFIFALLKNKYKNKFIPITILLLLYNFLTNPTNCDDWPKGLNNTYIENDENKYGCQIRFPKKCGYKLIRYTMDFSKLGHVTCKNKKKDARKRILKFSKSHYVNKNTTKFGFPLTNNDEGKKDGLDNVILKHYTSHNLMDMDKPIPSKLAKPEYIVDFSKDPFGELIINVNYNETLSNERKKLEKNSNPYSENVMILYIDSVSRANSIRQLKKTLNFFEQFMSYKGGHNKKYPKENFHSFQFFKYHAFKGLTHINFPKIFYGNDRQAKDLVRITKYFHENGYVMC